MSVEELTKEEEMIVDLPIEEAPLPFGVSRSVSYITPSGRVFNSLGEALESILFARAERIFLDWVDSVVFPRDVVDIGVAKRTIMEHLSRKFVLDPNSMIEDLKKIIEDK